MQNDTNMLGQTAYYKKAENWQVDSLNIKPQTFCDSIEIKETVTE